MKHANQKTANDQLVTDPEAAMRRTMEATRHILSVPKPAPRSTRRKTKHKK
jgi:hypothetical protein